MTYSSALDYLYGLQKHGIKLGLENIRTLLSRVDHPEARYQVLHIAGTNGKGSTAAMAASILEAAGYRVGLYTSPHLVDFRERVRVNGAMIPEARVVEFIDCLRQAAGHDVPLTFFELTTAMAFLYFAQASVDIAVVEVGMGGRYDATNVVTPVASAITTIALDHEEFLGSTIASIAQEKAGIIKPGVPLVVGRLDDDAARVIGELAARHGAPVFQRGKAFDVRGEWSAFDYDGISTCHRSLSSPLQGRHQLDNAACAIALVEAAALSGIRASSIAVRAGLAATRWEGRLEVVERHPTIVLDGAHNPAAARVVANFLADFRAVHGGCRVAFIFGMMRDKAYRAFLQIVLPWIDELIVTQADIPRAMPAYDLRDGVADLAPSIHVARTPGEALALARRLMTGHDLICVAGSLMLVGDMKALLHGRALSPIRG